jgi:flagellar hook-length control protein FliK
VQAGAVPAGAAQAAAVLALAPPTGAADAAGIAAAAGGAKAQNSTLRADSLAAPATDAPTQDAAPDAATALGAASAAAVASAARVITELADTTATDKHSRGGLDAASSAASTTGVDGTVAAVQGAAATSSASSNDATIPTFKVGAGVDSGEFGQGVANQVASMVAGNISSAKLSVNPPALGPIDVRIDVQGDQAQVFMTSHSAVTRDALQAGTPRLREMLSEQGFAQVSVDISQRSFQDRTPTAQPYAWNSNTDRKDYAAAATVSGEVKRAASGSLDAYA